MAEYEIPENFEELQEWVINKEAEQKFIADKVPQLNSEIQRQLAEEAKIKQQLNEMAAKRRELENMQSEMRRKARAESTAIEQAKRKLETFASEKALKERLEKDIEEFNRRTLGAPWREFAFDHQVEGAQRLASAKRAILGDKRGLGKSLTSLIYADMIGARKIMVFAPKDVLKNFQREINHWTPHRKTQILGGMPKAQRDAFLPLLRAMPEFLLLCNYEAWRRDPELIEAIKFLQVDTVIIDEAHNIKEKSTSAYRGIRDIVYAENRCYACSGDIERHRDALTHSTVARCKVCFAEPKNFGDFNSVKNVLPMTGTAILNKPQELWTLLNLVDRRLFPSEKAFLEDYCWFTGARWTFRSGGEEALLSKLGPRFIKRDKKSINLKGMPQTIVRHDIEFEKALYPDQWRVIQQIMEFGAIKMAEDVKLDIKGVLPDILRRRQAITWPAGIKIWEYDDQGNKTGRVLYEAPATSSCKMDKAMEIAQEIIEEEEDRVVIFSQFKEALKEFERRFMDLNIPVVRYDGDISDFRANQAQMDFDGKHAANHPRGTGCNSDCNNWGKYCEGYRWQVILCHYKKGGVGLNLNAARQMILLDREWNPGKEDQALGRIDRLDNKTDSIVHTIHVAGTIDAYMDNLLEQKASMIEGFEEEHNMLEEMAKALRDGMI